MTQTTNEREVGVTTGIPPVDVSDNTVQPPVPVSDSTVQPPVDVSEANNVAPIETFIDEETGDEVTAGIVGFGGGGGGGARRPPQNFGEAPRKEKDFFSKPFKVGGLELTPKHVAISLATGIGAFTLAKQFRSSPAATLSYVVTGLLAGLALGKLAIKNDK